MPIYAPGQVWNPGEFASILAIGDSWLWYPQNNLLQALAAHPQLKDPHRNIQLLGFNGARISEYVDRNNARDKYARAFKRELGPKNSQYYVAVLISGGGNDAVDYGLALRSDCSDLARAEDCIDPDGIDQLLKDISGALGLLIHDMLWKFHKRQRPVDIFLHVYDYPVPDRRGFDALVFKLTGPWLASAMDEAGVANELHPTIDGFDKIVDQRWVPLLLQLGYAS